ncbi:B12-binding domain-containing radical SAM protein [Patescibacteria group bacterium]|nr:B12-binding domain-containing radical SAM protein [Patescibacteria group bacterium]
MHITFITLPSPFLDDPGLQPLLGVGYLSSYIQSKGYTNVGLIDFNILKYDYNESGYLNEIPLDSDYYCIHCMTPQYKWLKQICRYLKSHSKGKIIVGGPHISNCPEDGIDDCQADIAVIGEGEEVLYDILQGKKNISIYTKDSRNKIRAYIKDLDSLPFPDRNMIDINKYGRSLEGKRAFHIVTLRGCPFSCAYCDRFSVGRNVRYSSINNVMEEIDMIRDKYGVNSFIIYDDVFTLSVDRVKGFCEEFKKRNTTWRCWSRTDTLDREKLSYMKDSGITQITMGAESFDDEVLRGMNKNNTAEQNRIALMLCKEMGIKAQCSLMYGNPGECKRSIDNTIKYVEEIQPDNWDLTVLTPIPGSAIWNNPEKFGISFDKQWLKSKHYQPCARTGSKSGISNIWMKIDTMTETEFIDNLKYFVERLEEVSPRTKKWKHYQNIKVENIKYET